MKQPSGRMLAPAFLVAFLLLPASGLALTGDITKNPADVVRKYARLDYKGTRLESISQEVLHPYTTWTEEPFWGKVVVIDGYDVLDHTKHWDIISMLEVVIPVEYRILGIMYRESVMFFPETRVEQVRFHVKAKLGRWRIIAPQFPPHVGLKRMIHYVRYAILQETDPARRDRLTALRENLEQFRR